MGCSCPLTTTSEALCQVFLLSPKPRRSHSLCVSLISKSSSPKYLPRQRPSSLGLQQYRNVSTFGARTPYAKGQAFVQPDHTSFGLSGGRDRPPRDEEIRAFKVYVVRPEDGRLSEPQILSKVLDTRERDEKGRPTQYLQEVLAKSEDRPYPICKMFDKKAAREADEAKRKAAKTTKMHMKQLEVSWTVSDNDLGHRMGRLKEFLEKGWRVEVIFGSKRKGWKNRREATVEEAERVLEKIRNVVREVEGAKERPMQGKVREDAVLCFEGKAKK